MHEARTQLPAEAVVLGAVFIAPLAFGTTEAWSRALLIGGFAALYLLRARLQELQAAPPPLFWGTVALVAFALLQSLSIQSPTAIRLAGGIFTVNRGLTLDWALNWGFYASLLLFLPPIFRSDASLTRLAWGFLLSGSLIAAIGIAQQQAGNTHYFGLRTVSDFRVPFGPFPSKSSGSGLLAMSALAGAGLLAAALQESRILLQDRRKDEFMGKLVVLLTLECVVLVGLVKARGRGAAFALCVAASLALAIQIRQLRGRSRVGAAALLLLLLGAGAVALKFAGVTIASLVPTAAENSFTFRAAMLSDGMEMLQAFPWSGVGLGAVRAAYPLWQDPTLKGYFVNHIHCDPLELALGGGAPLALLYFFLFAVTCWRLLTLYARTAGRRSPLPLAFLAATLSFFIHQSMDFPAQVCSLHTLAMLALAASWGALTPEGAARRQVTGKLTLAVMALLCILLSGVFAPRLAAAYFDVLSSRYPQPSKGYYQVRALTWEGTIERRVDLALANWALALENPAASPILMRTGLRYASEALDSEPYHPEALRVRNSLQAALRNNADGGEK